jgi:dTDP-4-amino-4,6-dideoxygalactose transaminase
MHGVGTRERLALFGGPKTIERSFKRYIPIGKEESEAAQKVIETGVLSKYIGAWNADFYGGPKVQEFETAWASYFGVKHAISVNSLTSGLIAAIGAIGVEPGDEVIVSPWTMCASATAILHWNAIPVFADIERETFCLDPASVESNITPFTKAILAVDIFGHSANMDALLRIASKHGLKVISDAAQAPGAFYRRNFAGTLADIGGYSLNYHKHIHTGEGGVLVTEDDELAERMQLIRNHAEAVVSGKGVRDLRNMLGYNFRLGEIECAIGIEQLKKLERLVSKRRHTAERLSRGLASLPGIRSPVIQAECTHVYYAYSILVDVERCGVSRERIRQALEAEGVEHLASGYANLHLLPMYQQKIAYGSSGFPWSSSICRRDVDYRKGICPTAEELHDTSCLVFEICLSNLDDNDVDLIVEAFAKVWDQLETLNDVQAH